MYHLIQLNLNHPNNQSWSKLSSFSTSWTYNVEKAKPSPTIPLLAINFPSTRVIHKASRTRKASIAPYFHLILKDTAKTFLLCPAPTTITWKIISVPFLINIIHPSSLTIHPSFLSSRLCIFMTTNSISILLGSLKEMISLPSCIKTTKISS